MKKIFAIAALVLAAATVQAQPPAGPAKNGDFYGTSFTATEVLSVPQLSDKLQAADSVVGQVKGTVKAVCAKKGCWLTMEMPDKSLMQVKFKGYSYFVPMDLVGKEVILNGTASKKLVSVNELKHFAEDAKKPQAEIDAITKPERQVKYVATGVLVAG